MVTLEWSHPAEVLPLGGYDSLKDPCVAHTGEEWHLFATGCLPGFQYEIVHAVAPSLAGPWRELEPCRLVGAEGSATCAPGVAADDEVLHMFLQQHYNLLGGEISHLVSGDGGRTFARAGTALSSLPGTSEAGIYDAHPAVVGGTRLLAYSGMSVVGQPEIHLALSPDAEWNGPWQRIGVIVEHDDVPFHNQLGHADYEWGLEGAQLMELPDGRTLLIAVCFLPDGSLGTRQRIFLATAPSPVGPYVALGPAIDPLDYAVGGENGHGTVGLWEDEVHLVFQHRDGDGAPWRLLQTSIPVEQVLAAADQALGAVEQDRSQVA